MPPYLRLMSCAAIFCASTAFAQLSGTVRDGTSGDPISGAKVRIQADLNSPEVTTNASGQFTLNLTPASPVSVAAFKAYDHTLGASNFYTETVDLASGAQSGIEIFLPRVPPRAATYAASSANSCGSCHADYRNEWTTSRHANAARNTWVLDLFSGTGTPGGGAGYVFKNTHNAGDSGFCATCHAPLADIQAPGTVLLDSAAITNNQREGVNCAACHSLAKVDANNINGLHTAGGTVGKTDFYFPSGPNAPFQVFGNLKDVSNGTMQNIYNPLFGESLLCASCHQYKNPTTNAPGQGTFEEWSASSYALPGPGFKTCQTCHMPEVGASGTIASGGPTRPSGQRHRHTFIGATPSSLADAVQMKLLPSVAGSDLQIEVQLKNSGAGHKFPTGVSIRNALLVVRVKRISSNQALLQNAGGTVPSFADDDVPGQQVGDLSGLPGKGFAKILRGRINGVGAQVEPVLFIDAETVAFDQSIAPGATDSSTYRFTVPSGVSLNDIEIDAQLLYRRAFRAMSVTKGWTTSATGGPIEIEVARQTLNSDSIFRNGFE